MTTPTGLITILTPCRNERENVRTLHEQIRSVMSQLPEISYEHLFIDNASTDGTQEELRQLAAEDSRVKVIFNQRNFGHVRSPFHGLLQARGDAVIVMAADLQDPPELIPQMVDKWIAGSKYIICARRKRNDPLIGKLFSRLYYFLVRFFVMKNYPIGGYDLALMDGILMKHIAESGKNVHTPLYAYWLGIEPEIIYYDREKRRHGKSRWNLGKKIKAFLDSLLSFSYVPIRFMSAIGIVTSLASLIFGIYIIIDYLLHGANGVRGFATIATLLSFLFGLVFFMLGVIGEYIWRIYDEISKRPETVIEEIF